MNWIPFWVPALLVPFLKASLSWLQLHIYHSQPHLATLPHPSFSTFHLILDAPTESESWVELLGVHEDLGDNSRQSQPLELIYQTFWAMALSCFFYFLAWLPFRILVPSFYCLVLSDPPWISPWKYTVFQNGLTDFLSFDLLPYPFLPIKPTFLLCGLG